MGRTACVLRPSPHTDDSNFQYAQAIGGHGVRSWEHDNKNNPLDYNFSMLTIVELPEYIRRAEKLSSASERNELAELVDVLVQIWQET
jgi:hypothetical protein